MGAALETFFLSNLPLGGSLSADWVLPPNLLYFLMEVSCMPCWLCLPAGCPITQRSGLRVSLKASWPVLLPHSPAGGALPAMCRVLGIPSLAGLAPLSTCPAI